MAQEIEAAADVQWLPEDGEDGSLGSLLGLEMASATPSNGMARGHGTVGSSWDELTGEGSHALGVEASKEDEGCASLSDDGSVGIPREVHSGWCADPGGTGGNETMGSEDEQYESEGEENFDSDKKEDSHDSDDYDDDDDHDGGDENNDGDDYDHDHDGGDGNDDDDDEDGDDDDGEGDDGPPSDLVSDLPIITRKLSALDVAQAQAAEEAKVDGTLDVEESIDQINHIASEIDLNHSVHEHAAFGLPQVKLMDSNVTTSAPRKADAADTVTAVLKELRRENNKVIPTTANKHAQITWERVGQEIWEILWNTLVSLDAMYVLVSVPLRIGFIYDPWGNSLGDQGKWTPELTIFTTVDIIGEIVRCGFIFTMLQRVSKAQVPHAVLDMQMATHHILPRHPTRSNVAQPPRSSIFSMDHDSNATPDAVTSSDAIPAVPNVEPRTQVPLHLLLVGNLPVEIFVGFVNFNLIHIARCSKLIIVWFSLYTSFSVLLRRLRRLQIGRWMSFSTLATPFYLFWVGLYLCHIAACGYMFLANFECGLQSEHCLKSPIIGSWVVKDRLERATFWRQYARSMYWAAKTVTTLGQGDLVPVTILETNYCIFVQFISGLWATSFLAACSFYFSRRNREIENGISTRLEQALRFLKSRNVPPSLAIQIRNYHKHVQRTRNGIEEERVLFNLPQHYRNQCAFFVRYRLLIKVPFFTKQPKTFLKTVVKLLKSDFLSPGQCAVTLHDIEELIVVSRGRIKVLDHSKQQIRVLQEEEWFAENSLFEDTRSKFELEATTFCEILRLSRPLFVSAMEKHFPKLRITTITAQQRRSAMLASEDVRSKIVGPSMDGNRAHRTTWINTIQQKIATFVGQQKDIVWNFPHSKFRARWRRVKLLSLLYLAVEVPYEIAFEWRHGFISDNMIASDYAMFLFTGATEIFFYIDLYFRAFKFVRFGSPKTSDQTKSACSSQDTNRALGVPPDSNLAVPVSSQDGLVTSAHDIFRQYRKHDAVLSDVVAALPISTIWNYLDHEGFSIKMQSCMRAARLLALTRLIEFKPTMQHIMIEFDLSPASQLLTTVIVSCVITTNAMACYFYALADDSMFVDSFPIGFDPAVTPITYERCLEFASTYGNCTWFMYDRSMYSIKARYVRSIHWSVVLLSTVGYGDIVSFSTSETVVGFWWIFIGAMICYFTSCAIGSVVSQVTVLSSALDMRIEEVNRALVRANVTSNLRTIIRNHYRANWELNGSVRREHDLMNFLPHTLRYELSTALYLRCVRRCYVFTGYSSQTMILREVAQMIVSMVFLPGVTIIEHGHLASGMYLLLSGEVELLLPGDKSCGEFTSSRSGAAIIDSYMSTSPFKAGIPHKVSAIKSKASSLVHPSPTGVGTQNQGFLRTFRPRVGGRHRVSDVPIQVLKDGDCFGEEGLLPHERYAFIISARALTSAQIGLLSRDAFLTLAERFPMQTAQMVALIAKQQRDNVALFKTHKTNLRRKGKIRQTLGTCSSLYVESKIHSNGVVPPDAFLFRGWRALHGLVVTYNFYQIVFRIAFLPYPDDLVMERITLVDYLLDGILYSDIYLKWNWFGIAQFGENIYDIKEIRRRYLQKWFMVDCLSMMPTFYRGDYFYMTLARLPRLLKSVQLFEYIDELELIIQEQFMKGSTTLLSLFDLVKFLVFFLSAAHHIGSMYFFIGRVLTSRGWAKHSWMTEDPILNSYPGDVLVQYIRSIYWCLETFTVVCFGDVLARNTVETVFASCTCLVGWFCIGQVMGKITSLMTNIDKDMHDHIARVDNFEQYARSHNIPNYLRERAIESIEYKSKCLIDLNVSSVFCDLPQGLHVALCNELYGHYLQVIPEFEETCTRSQLRALANAFSLQIYLADDIIVDEGRLGTNLFIMKEGRAEYVSSHSRMIFAAIHEGVLFGDLAFFLSGTRQMASIRASRSCQVLQLDRSTWMSIWPDEKRLKLEAKIIPIVRTKYLSVSRAFLNIVKNLEFSISRGTRLLSSSRTNPFGSGSSDSSHSIDAVSRMISRAIRAAHGQNRGNDTHTQTKKKSAIQMFSMANMFLNIKRIGRANKVLPQPGKRKLQHDDSVRSFSANRRLSNRLGIIPSCVAEDMTLSIEQQWKRHEQNLRVLKFIDKHQKGYALVKPEPRWARNCGDGVGDGHQFLRRTVSFSQQGSSYNGKNVKSSDARRRPPEGSRVSSLHQPVLTRNVICSPRHSARTRKRHSIETTSHDMKRAFDTVFIENNAQESSSRPHPSPNLTATTPRLKTQRGNDMTPDHTAQPDKATATEIRPAQMTPDAQTTGVSSALRSGNLLTATVESVPSMPNTQDAVNGANDTYLQHLETLRRRSKRRQQRRSVVALEKQGLLPGGVEIWVEPPLPPAFCMEYSEFRRFWSCAMLFICLYYIIVVPFRLAFDYGDLGQETSARSTLPWFVFEYVLDILCVIDFFLHKNYFTYFHRGELVTDKRTICDHYLKEGTYVIDLLCILPLEILVPFAPFLDKIPGTSSKFSWHRVATFRINKILRIIHLHELGERLQRILLYDVKVSRIGSSWFNFMRFGFDFALGAHWVACLFYGVAFASFVDGSKSSWLTTPGMLTFEGVTTSHEIGNVPLFSRYSRSYHFSIGAITTVSYGDIAPQNALEMCTTTVVIIVSIVLFGMLSSGFVTVLENEMGKRADYEEKIANVANFVTFHSFPVRIWTQMQTYFMVYWKDSQGMNEEELLIGLPQSVKQDVVLYAKRDFIKQMRLFASCDETFVRAVVAAFDRELFVRNDVIIAYGDRGRSLYVIETGLVLVRVPKRPTAAVSNLTSKERSSSSPSGPAVRGGPVRLPVPAATPSSSSFTLGNDASTAKAPSAEARSGGWSSPTASRTTPGDKSVPTSPRLPRVSKGNVRPSFSHGTEIEIVKGRFDFFGEKSLIFDVPRSATCIALTASSVLILTVESYENILSEFPEYREKNMHDWIFANSRENTPVHAIRTPQMLNKFKFRKNIKAGH